MLLAVGQQHERHGVGQHGDDRRVAPDSPSRGSGVRHSTHITSSVSAPRAHRPNATQGGATPASSAILISAKLEPQTAERSTKPGSQARDERACERVIGTALASGRDRRRTPVVPPTGPAAGGPVGGGPRGRRGHLGPGRDGRRGARSGAAVARGGRRRALAARAVVELRAMGGALERPAPVRNVARRTRRGVVGVECGGPSLPRGPASPVSPGAPVTATSPTRSRGAGRRRRG